MARSDKWLDRAARYEEILSTRGVLAAEEYMARFGDKVDKLIDALGELSEERRQIEREDRRARLQEVRRSVVTRMAGIRNPGLFTEY